MNKKLEVLTSKLVSEKKTKSVKNVLESAGKFNEKVKQTKSYITEFTENKYVKSVAPVLKKAASLTDEYIVQPYGSNIKAAGKEVSYWNMPVTNTLN